MEFYSGLDRCPACKGFWLDAQYDYGKVAEIWKDGLRGRVNSLWRYIELLPVTDAEQIITMGEGQSPLIRASKLQKRLGHPAIFIKDERQSPTISFKDRQAAVAVTDMREAGIQECVLASTGNAAAAYAAYCARADIKLWIFLTSLVMADKMREAALYGAEVVKVTGTYDQAKKVAADFAARRKIHFDKGAKAVPGKESMKTIAFEIAAELARQLGEPTEDGFWRAPDWFIQAVSGGIGPLGVLKGFEELYQMGLIDRVPKIGTIQVSGCSPMVQAFAAGKSKAEPVVPETRITVLATGDPGMSYELLFKASQTYGGHMLDVTDEEAFAAMRLLAKTEGISVEPATAVAFSGLDKLVEQGIIKTDEIVVVNCSGHTFPVEKYIMDEENVLDVRLTEPTIIPKGAPVDGLGAALKRLDEQVTTIVVIDDNPMDSRLIRRLLQAKKPYRVFEANSAMEGLEIIRDRLPDLVVSDLTMPEMDGFALLEELKKDPLTAKIPVIVVSAKDLTPEDEKRLAGQTASIWLKGSFSTQDLVEHVVGTLSTGEGDEKATTHSARDREETKEFEPQPILPSELTTTSLEVKKVVLVEDNPMDARLISRILQTSRPLVIKQVQVGREAVKVIREENPDLIVLDLIIPDMSGFQILAELKRDKKLDAIPVIVVTSKELSEAEKQLLISNHVSSMWQKGNLDREKLIAHVKSQLK
ncbi:MAG TPA: pyridoxal-phosphate dependent enzyme [Anaerolineae bacterium]|nr:pyridoxal-phosphate dependent enzyme [Anaerolineae bacterium]